MPRKPGLTPRQHADLGAELAALRDAVLHRSVLVSNAYPNASKQAVELAKALKALDAARCALDNALYREDPDGFEASVYYPGDARPVIEYRHPTGECVVR